MARLPPRLPFTEQDSGAQPQAATEIYGAPSGGGAITSEVPGANKIAPAQNSVQAAPTKSSISGGNLANSDLTGLQTMGADITTASPTTLAPPPGGVDPMSGVAGLQPGAVGRDEAAVGAPTDDAETTSPFDWSSYDENWKNLLAEHEKSGAGIEQMGNAADSKFARRAAESMGQSGRGMGGGYGGAMAQASLSGARERIGMQQEHDIRGQELKMTQLKDLFQRQTAAGEHERAMETQELINEGMLNLEYIRNGEVPPGMGDPSAEPPEPGPPEAAAADQEAAKGSQIETAGRYGEGGWESFRDYGGANGDENAYHDITHQHMNDELPNESGGTRSVNDVLSDMDADFGTDNLQEPQRKALANYIWGYYLQNGKMPPNGTVGQWVYSQFGQYE